jgi:hypothetical protein
MLFREIIAVYCENHTEHTDTLCGQIADLFVVKAGDMCCDEGTLVGVKFPAT